MELKPEVCGSRDLFVLENRIIQLFRGIFLISRPQKMRFIGINMFKRYIVDFSKKKKKKIKIKNIEKAIF